MPEQDFAEAIKQLCSKDPRYAKGAYPFVRAGLSHTLVLLEKKQPGSAGRHISGQQLLEGLRSFAIDQFGPLAFTVLDHWGIHTCRDFGNIVFNLIECGVFGKTEQDAISDFDSGYEFREAFLGPYEPDQEKRPG